MPLLDSFCVDHTVMKAPAVRLAKKMKTLESIAKYVTWRYTPGLHQKWILIIHLFPLKFLPFGKAMKIPSSPLSRFCGKRLQL